MSNALPDGASIFIRKLRLPARLGVYPAEQHRAQTIQLDIELGFPDLEDAARSDQLAQTVNYEDLATIARETVARRHYRLVESLAHAIASALLDYTSADWVSLRLAKCGCLPDADAAGVSLKLLRQG